MRAWALADAAGVANTAKPWGFTGFHYVYEPSKSSELQYWCEKRD